MKEHNCLEKSEHERYCFFSYCNTSGFKAKAKLWICRYLCCFTSLKFSTLKLLFFYNMCKCLNYCCPSKLTRDQGRQGLNESKNLIHKRKVLPFFIMPSIIFPSSIKSSQMPLPLLCATELFLIVMNFLNTEKSAESIIFIPPACHDVL